MFLVQTSGNKNEGVVYYLPFFFFFFCKYSKMENCTRLVNFEIVIHMCFQL